MKWVRYIRASKEPVRSEVLVWSNDDLSPMEDGPKWRAEVSCSTTDRIPFRMLKKRLVENYRPDIAQAVS